MVKAYGGDVKTHHSALIAYEENLHEVALIGIEDVDSRLAAMMNEEKEVEFRIIKHHLNASHGFNHVHVCFFHFRHPAIPTVQPKNPYEQ